jgi:multiple sugar transport system substrate-binding protein
MEQSSENRSVCGPVPPRASRRQALAALATLAATPVAAACGIGSNGGGEKLGADAEKGRVEHWTNPTFPFTEDIGADFAKEFKAKYPNIEYVPVTVAGDRFEKMVAAAAANSSPDVGFSTPYQVQELAYMGITRPLDDFLKQSKVIKQADMWPALTYDLIYKGKQYAQPFAPDVRVMFINDDVMRFGGLDPAKPAQNWDELEEHIKRIYRPGDNPKLGFPAFWGSGGNALWLVPFWQLGGETINKDGDKITIDNENGIKALEWLKKIYEVQGGWDAIAARMKQAPTPNTHFINGTMGYYFATFTERKSNEFLGSPNTKFHFTPWPQPKGGRRINYGGNHTYLITSQTKNPGPAWKWLEFLGSPDIVLRFAKRYDRIPIRLDVANGQAYQQNDPFLKLAVEEMGVRKFHIPAPGGGEIQALHNTLAGDVVSGKRAVREALTDYSKQMQQILDKFKK